MTSELDDLLSLSDYAWQRLRGRLTGLTDEEYLWEPVAGCWSIRPGADGVWQADRVMAPAQPEPVTTIAWRMCHIGDDVLGDERNATWIGLTPEPQAAPAGKPATAAEALARLEDGYGYWRRCLERVGDLAAEVGPVAGPYASSTRRSFVLHELDEFIHHGAEVGVLRDLYRNRTQ
jgi:DinB family protein